ncbi:MAG: tetratricopeptide repeat protein [Ignavibacteriae bacterium]|nr:tetratricopeptide repeat protein [Ignavibacteriota bacterium]
MYNQLKKINIISLILAITIIVLPTFAQSTRGLVNDGVDEYDENNFVEAEVNFRKGIENEIENYESHFNLGDALYKQGKFDEAFEEFKNTLPLATTDYTKAELFHNIGNSLLKAQKLKESIGAYREALKHNPNDIETKYNLSYALKQMKNQQQNQDNQDNKNDQNKDNKDDKKNEDKKDQDKKDEDKDKKDQDQQKKDEQKDNKDKKQDEQKQQPQEPKDEMSKQEAERILDALKNNEAELQKKMRQKKTKRTNVEKDW